MLAEVRHQEPISQQFPLLLQLTITSSKSEPGSKKHD
jgi:hypothetical protein